MAEDHPESPQRWTAKRRAALVLSILKGETSAQAAARKHGLTVAEVEDWRDRFLLGAECPPRAPEGRGSAEGRADQDAQAEGRRAGPRCGCPEGGQQGPPFCPEDVGRVRAVLPQVSQRRVCQVLAVARSTVRRPVRVDRRWAGSVNEDLVTRLTGLIERHPTFGYRRLWAILRFRDGQRITPKTVYRICALKRWFVHQRPVTPRPRVQGRISRRGGATSDGPPI